MTSDAPVVDESLKREFTLRSAFTLAFVFISPIVALYGVFALVLTSAGPVGWWAFVVGLAGQLFVAGTFAILSSKWPFEGSVYQWSRRLAGEHYGWFTGWAYVWTLVIAVMGGCYFIAGFIPVVLGIAPFSRGTQLIVAVAVVAVITALNASGPKVVKGFSVASLCAEAIGSIGIGATLLIAHRNQPLSVIFHSAGAGAGPGGYLWAGFLAAVGFVGWSFVGFESAGAIAEEVKDARRNVPKAIVAALVAIGAVVLFSCLALILATPDLRAAVSGQQADPAAQTITSALGAGITRPLFGLIIIGFLASALAAQTSGSRVIWSFARDGVLPGARVLAKLTPTRKYPINAVLLAGVMSGVSLLAAVQSTIYTTLVSFSTAGFFISFALPVVALLIIRLRGRWTPGPVTLGRWGTPIVIVAAAWTCFEAVNISWPRSYVHYTVIIAILVIALLGVVIWFFMRGKVATAEHELEVLNDEPVLSP